MLQPALVVVQAEQQRADERVLSRLVPAKAGHDAVRSTRVFHLEHRALARLVDPVLRFRDDTVEAGSLELREPFRGHGRIARHRRHVDRRLHAGEQPFEKDPALTLRLRTHVTPIDRKQIERDERRRRFLRQFRDAGGRWMQPHLQRIEIEAASCRDHDLAVEDTAVWQRASRRRRAVPENSDRAAVSPGSG